MHNHLKRLKVHVFLTNLKKDAEYLFYKMYMLAFMFDFKFQVCPNSLIEINSPNCRPWTVMLTANCYLPTALKFESKLVCNVSSWLLIN